MREIKFRLWCKDLEEIIEVNKMGFENNELWYIECIDHDKELLYFPEKNDHVLMQYTGLKDKNGKEIYEGDILETTSELLTNLGRTRTGRYHTSYNKVIWKDDGWGYEVIENNGIGLINGFQNKGLLNATKYSKVIGNIYENPNLIK